jgi:hypothetical protein
MMLMAAFSLVSRTSAEEWCGDLNRVVDADIGVKLE